MFFSAISILLRVSPGALRPYVPLFFAPSSFAIRQFHRASAYFSEPSLPVPVARHRLKGLDLHQQSVKPPVVLDAVQLAVEARGGNLEGVLAARDLILDIEHRAEVAAEGLAIGVGDSGQLIDPGSGCQADFGPRAFDASCASFFLSSAFFSIKTRRIRCFAPPWNSSSTTSRPWEAATRWAVARICSTSNDIESVIPLRSVRVKRRNRNPKN